MTPLHCDILIIGCGPTGVVLANLLGRLGHSVVVIERDRGVYPVPRATHIDEETLRNLQTTGLMPAILEHCTPFGKIDVVNEAGKVLFQTTVADPESVHGYAASHFFHQPSVEHVLREGLKRYPNVTLYEGMEAERLDDHGDRVTVVAKRVDQPERQVFEAAWVVGCDGGRSIVRNLLKIQMESLAPKRQWMIVDALLKTPADGHSLRSTLPANFRYMLDPQRLTIYAHGIGANRRWEFQLDEGEAVPDDAEVLKWVSAHVDLSAIEILRIASYAHNALIAERWQMGRVFVAGDAAHMMPPSAGQGLCSGIRDAINLAWKLDRVLGQRAHPALLDTYQRERQFHLREVLKGTLFIGSLLEAETSLQRWWRDRRLQAINSLPAVQSFFRQLSLRRPALQDGFLSSSLSLGGHHMPQTQVQARNTTALASVAAPQMLDDVLGYRFALIVKSGLVPPALADWARQRDIGVWEIGHGFTDVDVSLLSWMRDKKIDFALVRPDHHLFGAGTENQIGNMQVEFDTACWGPQ